MPEKPHREVILIMAGEGNRSRENLLAELYVCTVVPL